MNDYPTTYDELASVVESLPLLVREKRRRAGLSLRQAAPQIGVTFSTIKRIEDGADFNSRALPELLRWLGDA